MPRLNKPVITEWLVEHDKSAHWLSEQSDIPLSTLKNAIWSGDQMRAGRVRTLSRVLAIDESRLIAEDPEPTPEPTPKKEKTAPNRRQNGEKDRRGPSRVAAA